MGHFCVVECDVVIGDGCTLGHHVILRAGTILGDGCRVDDHAVVGKKPMKAAASVTTDEGELPPARVGPECIIGTGAVVYRGAVLGGRVLVADLATVREHVTIGERTIIGRGAAIENRSTVGARCKLETNAYITAFSTVGDDVFVAPCAATSNDNYMGRTEKRFDALGGPIVERGARIGTNATLLPGCRLGPDAVVGAGAVATRDVPSGKVVAGVPARVLKDVPEEELLKNQR